MNQKRDLRKLREIPLQTEILVIGVGEENREDDGVGPFVARNLRLKNLPGVSVEILGSDGLSLMESWKDTPAVIVLDAMKSGAPPGTIRRLNSQSQYLRAESFNRSTHAFGVAEALELAKTLKRLPPYLVIYGIEGKRFAMGTGLSPEVEKAAIEVTDLVISDISKHMAPLAFME